MSFVLSTIIPSDAEERKLIFSKEVTHDNLKWKLAAQILRVWPHRATHIEAYVECLPVVPGTPFDTRAKFTFNNTAKMSFPDTFCSTKPQSRTLRFKIEDLAQPSRVGYHLSTIVNLWPQTPQNSRFAAERVNLSGQVVDVPSLDTARIESLEKEVASLKLAYETLAQRIQKLDGQLQETDGKVAILEKPAEESPDSNTLDQEENLEQLQLYKNNLSETITMLEGQLAKMKISNTDLSDSLKDGGQCNEQAANKEFEEVKRKLQLENIELTRAAAVQIARLENMDFVLAVEKKESKRKYDEMEAKLKERVDKLEKEIKEKDAKILDLTRPAGIDEEEAAPPAKKKAISTGGAIGSSSIRAAELSDTKMQDAIMFANLLNSGIGVNEIMVMNSLPKDTKIPFKHRETKEMLPESDWPIIKNLTIWIVSHPEYVAEFEHVSSTPATPGPTAEELATSRQQYFKVEMALAKFGWGRWNEMKKSGDLEISEVDIEHMCRTLLLHCLREFRGEDRVRRAVFDLITPPNVTFTPSSGTTPVYSPYDHNVYKQGWAALPEYNPPCFKPSTFLRHVKRHANKLIQKIDLMRYLEQHMIGDQKALVECPTTKWNEVEIHEFQLVSESFVDGWDTDCDEAFLVGCWRHGLDNFDAINADVTLGFVEKNLSMWPTSADCWLRFKRLVGTSQRNWFDPAYKPMFNKKEEQEFMRILRSIGLKDAKNAETGVGYDWSAFRELSPILKNKNDLDLHEMLLCVLAMFNKAKGTTNMTRMDFKRALVVDPLSARRSDRLLNRIKMMQRVHNQAEQDLPVSKYSICETAGMPAGWTNEHDKELIMIADKCGLDGVQSSVVKSDNFVGFENVPERTLHRRILEVANTMHEKKWQGVGDYDIIDDSDWEEKAAIQKQQAKLELLRQQYQQQQAAEAAKAAALAQQKQEPQQLLDVKQAAANMQDVIMFRNFLNVGIGENEMRVMNSLSKDTKIPFKHRNTKKMLPESDWPIIRNLKTFVNSHPEYIVEFESVLSSTKKPALSTPSSAQSFAPQKDQTTLEEKAAAQQKTIEVMLAAAGINRMPQQSTASPAPTAPAPSTAKSSSAAAAQQQQMLAAAVLAAAVGGTSESSSAAAAELSAAFANKQDAIMFQNLLNAGVGVNEIMVMNCLPKDTKIPFKHRETKMMLTKNEWPTIKDLTTWIVTHPEYIADFEEGVSVPTSGN